MPEQPPVAHEQPLHARLRRTLRDAEYIDIAAGRHARTGSPAPAADGRSGRADAPRVRTPDSCAAASIFALNSASTAWLLPSRNITAKPHVVRVPFPVDQAHAGCAATVDLMLQAGPRPVLEEAVLAGPDAEQLLQDVEAVAHCGGTRKRTEVAPPAARPTVERQARKVMLGQVDVGVGLVVAQDDVVGRPLRLDQALLEQKRFRLAAGDGHLDVAHLGDERHGLRGQSRGAEVGGHPRLQVARLADVEHRPVLAHHPVDAWARGQCGKEGFRVERCHCRSGFVRPVRRLRTGRERE